MAKDPPKDPLDLSKPAPDEAVLRDRAPKEAAAPRDLAEEFADAAPDPEDLAALTAWEPEATPGSLVALLPNKWVRRAVLAAIPLLALFFGSGLILASQLSLSHALQVFGTTTSPAGDSSAKVQTGKVEAVLRTGARNALRVALWNRRTKKHEHKFDAELRLRGGPGNVNRRVFDGVSGPGTALEANFTLPDLAPGRYSLDVDADLDGQAFHTRIPARLVREAPQKSAVPIEQAKPGADLLTRTVDAERFSVEFLPAAGKRVTTELVERITVRTTDEAGTSVFQATTASLSVALITPASCTVGRGTTCSAGGVVSDKLRRTTCPVASTERTSIR